LFSNNYDLIKESFSKYQNKYATAYLAKRDDEDAIYGIAKNLSYSNYQIRMLAYKRLIELKSNKYLSVAQSNYDFLSKNKLTSDTDWGLVTDYEYDAELGVDVPSGQHLEFDTRTYWENREKTFHPNPNKYSPFYHFITFKDS
ncbi:MAG: hypothetical protein AAFX87_27100, partial [Bacteroidota bacterium]